MKALGVCRGALEGVQRNDGLKVVLVFAVAG